MTVKTGVDCPGSDQPSHQATRFMRGLTSERPKQSRREDPEGVEEPARQEGVYWMTCSIYSGLISGRNLFWIISMATGVDQFSSHHDRG